MPADGPPPRRLSDKRDCLKAKRPSHEQVRLQVLADELHVHVRTLRAAARDGRLAATFGPRPFFGKLTATATREAGARFMAEWYRRTYGRGRRRLVPICRVIVPANYAATLVGLRRRLGLSQQQMAVKIGVASKAVVYQWESGKRKPSQVFWLRVERLQRQRAISPSDRLSAGVPKQLVRWTFSRHRQSIVAGGMVDSLGRHT